MQIKSPQVRLIANVALICETIISEPPLNPKDIKRENIQCKLTYVALSKKNPPSKSPMRLPFLPF